MLHFRPLPAQAEPEPIRKARATLERAFDHPDALRMRNALDALSHAMIRLSEIVPECQDAPIREALGDSLYGARSVLADCIGDAAFALECWMDDARDREAYAAQDRFAAHREV